MPKSLSPVPIFAALEKVSSSRTFWFAGRQRSFLRYIASETLEGRAAELKEYSIGIAVFGKGEAFDPRVDSIVRVEARELRARLAKYSKTEGKDDAVHFKMPVGHYVPVFENNGALSKADLSEADLSTSDSSKEVQPLRIAVLQFGNRSASTRNQRLCDVLTDELNHAIASVRGIDVASRTSVSQFEGQGIDARELADGLVVDAMVEGSVHSSADRLRILVQLNHGSTGRTV